MSTKPEPQEKRSRFVSLRVKLLVGFTLAFLLFTALAIVSVRYAFSWFYNFATDMAMQRIQEDLVDTLNGAIEGVNIEDFVALTQEATPNADGTSDDPRYWEHLAWLQTVHNIEPRAIPYTYIKGSQPDELLYVGDATVVVLPDRPAAAFLESYISRGAMAQSLNGLVLKMEPYEDDWGQWVSAYAPLRDANGQTVGGMGIDFRADYVYQVQASIRSVVGTAMAVAISTLLVLIIALLILVFVVSSSLTRPVISLTRISERVAEGNYDQDLSGLYSGKLRDEVSTLAQVFALMISKVYAREQRLKQEVAQLRIEIDQVKKARQVAEITETDYFYKLREKARKIRSGGDSTTAE